MSGRLLLRDDAHYARSADGAYVLSHRGAVALAGGSVYAWLDRLAPFLDGSRTLADLTGGLPPERRQVVERLVAALLERGVVREVGEDGPGPVPAPAVAFLDSFRDSAASAFARYRDLTAVVVGGSELSGAVVRAAVRSGLRSVSEAAGPDDPVLAEADLAVQVTDRIADAQPLERRCRQLGIPLAQALVLDGEAWLTGADGHGLTAAWRRRTGSPATGGRTRAWATVVAGQLVQDVFRQATGVRPPARSLTRVALDTLATSTHRYLPHPLDLPAAADDEERFLARVRELDAGDALDDDEFSRRAATLSDARFGVIGEITEGDFVQLPLHVARTTAADPEGPDAPRPVVTGAGSDFASARYVTALRALAAYGARMVDPRRLVGPSGRPLPADDARSALAALRAGELDGRVRAIGLADGRPLLLAADQAFPALRRAVAVPCGAAAAYRWADAVEAGLLQHCRRLTVAEVAASDHEYPLVDLRHAPVDPVAERHLALLGAVGEPLAVHDVTGALGVPTLACSLGGGLVAYGCGLSTAAALKTGLLDLLLRHQAAANDEPEYAPDGPDLRVRQRTSGVRPVAASQTVAVGTVVARLVRAGRVPAVVPLDHDPEVHRTMPYLAQVVLIDD